MIRKVVKLLAMLIKRVLEHKSIALRELTYDRSVSRLGRMNGWY